MLSKLIKYDFKAIFKLFIPMSIFILVYSCIGTLLFRVDDTSSFADTKLGGILTSLVIGMYVLSCFAYFIVTQGIIVVNFYKSMVTDTGYLTHTLPVKKSTILTAKMISGFVTLILTYVIFAICLAIMLDIPAILIDNSSAISLAISQIIEEFGLGSIIRGIIAIVILAIIGVIQSLAMFYLSIALGQLMNRHKVVGSLVSYFGIVLVLQIASTFFAFFLGFRDQPDGAEAFNFLWNMCSVLSLAMLAVSAGMLALTHFIFNRKLNLE